AQPIAAAACCEVVQRLLEAVAAEEPFERTCRPDPVLGRTGDREGGELGLDQRRRVERLLIARAFRRLVSAASAVTDEAEHVAFEARLVAEPAERLEAELGEIVAVECDAAADQRLRKTRIVVAECVLEPVPAVDGGAFVGVCELCDEPLEQASCFGLEAVGVET